MNFIEASKLLLNGKQIRRKSWDKDLHLYAYKDIVYQMWKMWNGPYNLNVKDVIEDDWEEYSREEPADIPKELQERLNKAKLLKEAEERIKKLNSNI